MALPVLVLVALAAAPVKVAMPGFSLSDVPAERGNALSEYLSQKLSTGGGLTVTTAAEIQAVLGNERQRQLLGCQESSCMAELTGALGADYLIIGSLARIGGETLATLKCIKAATGEARGSWSTRTSDEKKLIDFLDASAEQLRELLLPAPPSAARSPLRFIPVAVGGAAVITGGVLFALSRQEYGMLHNGDPSITSSAEAHSVAFSGQTKQTAAYVVGGIGAALLVGGLVYALRAPSTDAVAFGAGWDHGPVVGLSGVLP